MLPRRVEVWALPDDPDGFRSLLELEIVGWSAQDPDDTPGKGSVSLNPDYEFLDQILTADPTDVAASSSTLICLFGDHDPDVPDFEFFADQRVDPIGPGLTSISGPDIRSGLNDGKVHPRAPGDPIWLWGQPTLTRNPDLTEGLIADEEFDVWIVGGIAGDTWRIDLGATGWSAAIDFDASNSDVKAAIEAGPSSVVEANVVGSGTVDDPWKIHIVDPTQTDYSVQVDDADITGEIFVRFISDGGELKATYYTPVRTIDGVLFGVQGTWRVEIDPLDGLPSILVAGNSAFIGVQQVLDGVAGIHGYATVEIRPLISGARFRLGIRDVEEHWIYTVEDDLVTGSYQTLTIPNVELPAILDQIILRAAVIEDSPPDFYVRNLKFHRGMPGTTWGDITLQLVGAAQARGTLTWLDTSGITVATDFNGNAWDNPSLEFRADPGMDIGTHIMADGKALGYEYDIVRLAVPVGALTHELRVWNRGGRGAVKTVDPAIIVGDITSGSIAKRRLPFTHLLVEYGTLQFTEVTHVDFAGLPRREGFIRAEQATDEATAIQVGETYILDQIDDMLATQVNPTSVNPYEHADVGDEIPYELGRHAGRHSRRIHTIATTFQNDEWSSELTGSSLFATEKAAQWEAIRRLQEAFDRKNFARDPRSVLPQLTGAVAGGGIEDASWVFAASNTPSDSKPRANQTCAGTGDQDDIIAAILASEGGTIGFLPGTYVFDDGLRNADRTTAIHENAIYTKDLRLRGSPGVRFTFGSNPAALMSFIVCGDSNITGTLPRIIFDGIQFDAQGMSNVFAALEAIGVGSRPAFEFINCTFTNFQDDHVFWGDRQFDLEVGSCLFFNCDPDVSLCHVGGFSTGIVLIHNNNFYVCTGNVWSGAGFSQHGAFFENGFSGSLLTFNAGEGPFWHNWLGSVHDPGDHSGATGIVLNTLADAKGDVIAATANDTWARLAVGTNKHALHAASAEATGLKWQLPSGRTTIAGFHRENLADSLTASQLERSLSGALDAALPVVVTHAGSIVGISVASTEARTASTATFEVYKNGAATGLTCVLDGTNTQYAFAVQAIDLDAVAAGDRLDVRVTTTGTWTPITADVEATIVLQYDPA